MKCKTCGIKYHHCDSCGCDGYSEYGYCSNECKNQNNEFATVIKSAELFIKSLSDDQLKVFEIFYNAIDNYEQDIDTLVWQYISDI